MLGQHIASYGVPKQVEAALAESLGGGLSLAHSFPRAVPDGVEKKGLVAAAGPGQRLQAASKAVDRRIHKVKGRQAPWGGGTGST